MSTDSARRPWNTWSRATAVPRPAFLGLAAAATAGAILDKLPAALILVPLAATYLARPRKPGRRLFAVGSTPLREETQPCL